MAQELVPGANYLESFTDGQGGGAGNYANYAPDLDINFTSIRVSVNQLVQEVRGLQGPNQVLPLDILLLDDPSGIGITNDVLIGVESYLAEFISTTQVDVSFGTALVGTTRVQAASGVSLSPVVGTDDSGTDYAYIALDVNGAVSINTAPGSQQLDIWRVEVNGAGTAFVDNIQKVGSWQYAIDGDAWVEMSDASSLGGSSFPNLLVAEPKIRINRIERLLSGYTTDLQGTPATIGPIFVPGGSAATPGLALSDGAGVFDPNTGVGLGLGADRWGWATAGTKRGEFDAEGNLDLDTNARVKGVRSTAQTISTATPTLIDFDAADDVDQGNGTDTWHDHTSGTLSDREEFTCPTGCDGWYMAILDFEFEVPVSIWDLHMEITLNGTKVAADRRDDGSHEGQVVWFGQLSATDVVRGRVTVTGSVSLDLDAATLSIVKVA